MSNNTTSDSWHNPTSSIGKSWVNTWRKIYHPLGFRKGYNFPLFVIFAGALMGFVIARFEFYNFNGIFLKSTHPSDAVIFSHGIKRIGIIIHLACILPAGLLACFQFVPAIRYKFILFHRINGYVIILLFLIANAAAYIIIPTSAGGGTAAHVALGLLATGTTITNFLAYYNIKRLQIDQHRAWMLRTWFYAGSVISLDLIMLATHFYLQTHSSVEYFDVQSCSEIWKIYKLYGVDDEHNPTTKLYSACTGPESLQKVVVSTRGGGPESKAARIHCTYGMSLFLAMAIHAIGVEIYLRLTPVESQRLRTVSHERQVEAGLKHPGSACLTNDRLGDAPKSTSHA
jgi:Predicted membrane protein (DUF2306)